MYMPTFQDLSDDIYPLTLRWPGPEGHKCIIPRSFTKYVRYAIIHIEMYMPTFQDRSDDIHHLTLRWPWRSQNHNSRVICQKIQNLVKYAKIHIEESICQLCEDIHHFTLRMRWLWRSQMQNIKVIHIYAMA
jgi:hypothetical protein